MSSPSRESPRRAEPSPLRVVTLFRMSSSDKEVIQTLWQQTLKTQMEVGNELLGIVRDLSDDDLRRNVILTMAIPEQLARLLRDRARAIPGATQGSILLAAAREFQKQ